MRKMLNTFLQKFLGIKIVRSQHYALKKRIARKTGSPLYIEFIGPSGVGKSTLYNEAKRQNKQNNWIGAKEFVKVSNYHIDDTFYSPKYDNLAEVKLQYFPIKDISSWDRMKLIAYFYSNIRREVIINLNNKNSTVVFEGGILHNFDLEIASLHQSKPALFKELIDKRAIVYCCNTPENIAKQILKREKETGQIRAHHKTNSFEELVKQQKDFLEMNETHIETFSRYQVPVLTVDTSDNLAKNAHKVNAFIRKLQQTGLQNSMN
jgi:septin family protein